MVALDNFENWTDLHEEYQIIKLSRTLISKSILREIKNEEYDDNHLYDDRESNL